MNSKLKKIITKKRLCRQLLPQSILTLSPFYFLERGSVGCHLGAGRQASALTLDGGAMSWEGTGSPSPSGSRAAPPGLDSQLPAFMEKKKSDLV